MIISERLFAVMKEKNVSIRELSRRTGITASTISDWNTKKTNPSSDKLMSICEALEITPLFLLTGEERNSFDYLLSNDEINLIERYRRMDGFSQKRFISYLTKIENKD